MKGNCRIQKWVPRFKSTLAKVNTACHAGVRVPCAQRKQGNNLCDFVLVSVLTNETIRKIGS